MRLAFNDGCGRYYCIGCHEVSIHVAAAALSDENKTIASSAELFSKIDL